MSKRGNGEGSIYYSEKLKRWVGQFSFGRDDNGKLNRKTIYGKTRKEVSEKISKNISEINAKKFIDKSNIKLIDIIKSIREDKFNANVISEGQYARLGWTISVIENSSIGDVLIQNLTKDRIQDFLNSNKHYSNSYLRKLYELINQACKKAVINQLIYINPMSDIIRPKSIKETSEIESLTIDEQKLLSDYLFSSTIEKEPYKNLFLIQLYMGIRVGEALALNLEDVDLENNLLYIRRTLTRDKDFNVTMGKTTKTYAGKRDLPIPYFLLDIIKKQLYISESNQYKLLFYNNGLIANTTMTTVLKRIFKTNLKLEKSVGTHALRHTYATRCIEAGMTPVVLQRLMGHTDIKVTLNTYASIFNKFKEDELEKVDKYLVALKLH